jgi:hypothetical protein
VWRKGTAGWEHASISRQVFDHDADWYLTTGPWAYVLSRTAVSFVLRIRRPHIAPYWVSEGFGPAAGTSSGHSPDSARAFAMSNSFLLVC